MAIETIIILAIVFSLASIITIPLILLLWKIKEKKILNKIPEEIVRRVEYERQKELNRRGSRGGGTGGRSGGRTGSEIYETDTENRFNEGESVNERESIAERENVGNAIQREFTERNRMQVPTVVSIERNRRKIKLHKPSTL